MRNWLPRPSLSAPRRCRRRREREEWGGRANTPRAVRGAGVLVRFSRSLLFPFLVLLSGDWWPRHDLYDGMDGCLNGGAMLKGREEWRSGRPDGGLRIERVEDGSMPWERCDSFT